MKKVVLVFCYDRYTSAVSVNGPKYSEPIEQSRLYLNDYKLETVDIKNIKIYTIIPTNIIQILSKILNRIVKICKLIWSVPVHLAFRSDE